MNITPFHENTAFNTIIHIVSITIAAFIILLIITYVLQKTKDWVKVKNTEDLFNIKNPNKGKSKTITT